MLEQNKVSIIIPVFNGQDYIKQAIDSALSQSYKNCEIVVVDDGSTDATAEIVKTFGNAVRYFYKENGGVASALNMGIQNMTGLYFAWLSHDDVFYPKKIQSQLDSIANSHNENTISIGNFDYLNNANHQYTNSNMEKYFDVSLIQSGCFPLFWFELHFSSLLFHKNHFKRIGLFDEKLKTSQDNDMIFRLLRNQKTAFVSDPVSVVRVHRQSGTYKQRDSVNEENRKFICDITQKILDEEIEEIGVIPSVFFCKIAGVVKSMGQVDLSSMENRITKLENSKNVVFKSGIIIFGAGQYGVRLKYELDFRDIAVVCFADNDMSKHGTLIDGVRCLSVKDALQAYPSAEIVIAQKLITESAHQLETLGVKRYYEKNKIDSIILNIAPSIKRSSNNEMEK